MANLVPRKNLIDACLKAIVVAEETYTKWTPKGYTMRAAPESFVQMIIAQELFSVESKQGGVKLLLEASVAELLKQGEKPNKKIRTGRIDIVVYYKSKPETPRLLIEVKKITKENSLNEDLKRILELMDTCKCIQNGILIGYGTRASEEGLAKLFAGVERELNIELNNKHKGYQLASVREKAISNVATRKGVRSLNAVVYKVTPRKHNENLG